MFPRWVHALFAVEVAGIVALVVVAVHLASAGVSTAGSAVAWAQPHLRLNGPLPSLSLPLPIATPAPTATPRSPIQVIATGNGLLDTLNGSTKTVTMGQIRILGELEQAIKGYVETQLRSAAGG